MHLKSLLCALPLACAFAAHADDFVLNVPLVAGTPGAYSGAWGVTHLEAGSFTDTITFTPGGDGAVISASLVTIGLTVNENIDFTSASINGNPFTLSPTGILESGYFVSEALAAPLTMMVSGIVAPTLPDGTAVSASYGATLNLAPIAAPIPELSPGAMLAAGLCMIGFIAGRRRQQG